MKNGLLLKKQQAVYTKKSLLGGRVKKTNSLACGTFGVLDTIRSFNPC